MVVGTEEKYQRIERLTVQSKICLSECFNQDRIVNYFESTNARNGTMDSL